MVSTIYLNFQYFGKHICGLTMHILKNPICLFYILLKWLLQPLIIHRLLPKLSQYHKSRTISRWVCSHDAGQLWQNPFTKCISISATGSQWTDKITHHIDKKSLLVDKKKDIQKYAKPNGDCD